MGLATPPGLDNFYAFCEKQVILKPAMLAGQAVVYCTAILGRDHVAVFLNAGSPAAAQVKQAITRYVPAAAKALVAAVPVP